MSLHELTFSTELSGPGRPPGVVRALVAHALGFTIGLEEDVAAALTELEQAMAQSDGTGRRSRLEIQSVAGRMEIALWSDDRAVWRISRPLA